MLRAVGGAERASTRPHACDGANRAAVRSQEQCKLCSCPRVTVCCGMNHCSCLSFPPGADGPGLFAQRRRGTRRRRGPRLPALSCGRAPQPPPQPDRVLSVHTSAHSALRAASCTLARTWTPVHAVHTARTAAIAHSGVQAGTSVCSHPPPPPPVLVLAPGPLSGCAHAAPAAAISIATLRIYQWGRLRERSGRGGKRRSRLRRWEGRAAGCRGSSRGRRCAGVRAEDVVCTRRCARRARQAAGGGLGESILPERKPLPAAGGQVFLFLHGGKSPVQGAASSCEESRMQDAGCWGLLSLRR